MSKLACPFCYHRIDGRKLWFRCTGRGSPGKPGCKPQHDAARKEHIGIEENVLPAFAPPAGFTLRAPDNATCPFCGADSGVKVCPVCHTKLPATFGQGRSPLIAMVGAKRTGKTVYLKVLSHQLRKKLGRRFSADVRLTGDSQFQADGRADFIDPAGELFPDGKLYAQTAGTRTGRREPIVFAWRQVQRRPAFSRYDTTYLSFYDTAGEDLNTEGSVGNLRYLAAADALILLLDPFMIPQARDHVRLPAIEQKADRAAAVDVLGRVTDNLRATHKIGNRKNIPIPVAVAFAKIDAFFDVLGDHHPLVQRPKQSDHYDEALGQATHEHVRALLHQWEADDIDSHLTLNYKTFRYFAVSALGTEPDYDHDRVDERGVQPFRVDEPLLWLLSRFGVVETGGR